jgi:hypothetical protein
MQWYEKHYKQCEKYIYAVQHPTEFTREELNKIVVEQRIAEGDFMKSMMSRKNITYSNYCSEMQKVKRNKQDILGRRDNKRSVSSVPLSQKRRP